MQGWMSWLEPLEKIQNSYLSLLSHLLYQFSTKKTIQWIFLFMSTWQFRLTVAGCIDILRLCFHTKNLLESVKSLTAVQKYASQLDDELTKYCPEKFHFGQALAGAKRTVHGEAQKVKNWRICTGHKGAKNSG